DDNSVTVVLLDGPANNPRQAITLRMFWRPRAGLTPLDAEATNATMHYIVFPLEAEAGNDTPMNATRAPIGIYTGAGFLYPKRSPGAEDLLANVWDASLRLTDAGEGFVDLLGPATITGDLRATRDDAGVQDAIRQLNQLVADRLGYPRLVMEMPDSELAQK
ncbi:MAG: hypothetical protein MI741_18055, partial [Rhodospirillales bacterium]|nr:hypothetical protein [Rhodospirillales bacterium]